jgi:hypothetical protein
MEIDTSGLVIPTFDDEEGQGAAPTPPPATNPETGYVDTSNIQNDPFKVATEAMNGTLGAIGASWRVGQNDVVSNTDALNAMLSNTTAEQDKAHFLNNPIDIMASKDRDTVSAYTTNFFTKGLSSAVSSLAMFGAAQGEAAKTGIFYGAVAQSPAMALGAESAGVGLVAGVPLFVGGFKLGTTVGTYKFFTEQYAAAAYKTGISRGMSKNTARVTGALVGGIQAAVETIQLGMFENMTKQAAVDVLKSRTFQEAIKPVLKGFLMDALPEYGEEVVQQLVEEMGMAIPGLMESGMVEKYTTEVRGDGTKETSQDRMTATMIDSILPTLLLTGGFKGTGVAVGAAGKQTAKALNIDGKNPVELLQTIRQNLADLTDQNLPTVKATQNPTTGVFEVTLSTSPAEQAALAQGESANVNQPSATPIEQTTLGDLTIGQVLDSLMQPAQGTVPTTGQEILPAAGTSLVPTTGTAMTAAPAVVEGRVVGRTNLEEAQALSPVEQTALVNQLDADVRALKREERLIQRQVEKEANAGSRSTKGYEKLAAITEARMAAEADLEIVKQGTLTRNQVEGESGKIPMKKLAKVVDMARKAMAKGEAALAKAEVAFQKKLDSTVVKGEVAAAKAEAKGVRQGSTDTRAEIKAAQQLLKQIINAAPISKQDRNALLAQVTNVTSTKTLDSTFLKINERVADKVAKNNKKALEERIDNALSAAKTRRAGKFSVGTLPADVQEKLMLFKLYNKNELARDDAINEYEKAEQAYQDGTTETEPTSAQAVKYAMAVLARNAETASLPQLEGIVTDLENLVIDGQQRMEAMALERKARQDSNRAIARDAVNKDWTYTGSPSKLGQLKQLLEAVFYSDQQWMNFLEMLGMPDGFLDRIESIHTYEANMQATTADMVDHWNEALASAGDTRDVVTKGLEDSGVRITLTYTDTNGQPTKRTYSKPEWLTVYAHLKAAEMNTKAANAVAASGWTNDLKEQLEGKLTPADKALVDATFEFNDAYFEDNNDWHKEKTGVPMVYEQRYVPQQREGRDTHVSQIKRIRMDSALPKSSLSRTADSEQGLRVSNFYTTQMAHIDEWESKKAKWDLREDVTDVIGDGKFRLTMERRYGPQVLGLLDYAAANTVTHQATETNPTDKLITHMRGRIVVAKLGGKFFSTLAKNFGSIVTYGVNIPLHKWPLYTLKALGNLKQNSTELLANSPIQKARVTKQSAELAAAVSTRDLNLFKRSASVSNFLMGAYTMQDNFNVLVGGGALNEYLKETQPELTENQRLLAIESITIATQSSNYASEQGQNEGRSAMHKLASMFMGQQRQLKSHTDAAMVKFFKSKDKKKAAGEFAKAVLVYHILPAVLYQMAASGVTLLFPPDEDDPNRIKDEAWKLVRAGVLGALNGGFILGEALNTAAMAIEYDSTKDKIGISTDSWRQSSRGLSLLTKEFGTDLWDVPIAFNEYLQNMEVDREQLIKDIEAGNFTAAQDRTDKARNKLILKTLQAADIFGLPDALSNSTLIPEALEQKDPYGALLASPIGGYPRSVVKARWEYANAHTPEKEIKRIEQGKMPMQQQEDSTNVISDLQDQVDVVESENDALKQENADLQNAAADSVPVDSLDNMPQFDATSLPVKGQ